MAAIRQRLSAVKRAALSGFLCLGFFYCLVPTESIGSNRALVARLAVAVAIVVVVVTLLKPRISRSNVCYLIVCFLVSLMALVRSFGGHLFLFWFSLVFAVTLSSAAVNNRAFRQSLSQAVLALLVLSVFLLLFQIAIYLYSGSVLEIHEMLFPYSGEARIQGMEGLLRFSSFYIEPGTYSNWVYLFLMIYMALNPDAKAHLIFLVASSMALTLSAWGVLVGLLLVGVTILQNGGKGSWLLLVPVALALAIAPMSLVDAVLTSLHYKLSPDEASAGYKMEAYEQFQQIAGDVLVLGDGFSSKFCQSCLSPQDAGFALNLAVVMGVFFLIGVFGVYFATLFRAGSIRFAVLSLPLLFTKAYYWEFSVWLLLFLVISGCLPTQRRLHSSIPRGASRVPPGQLEAWSGSNRS